ncbi:helix-turn-helix domain-containing protein [Bacillus subtilis]|uniref:helix-turn-helix domain-containing protein n=1 Tax=Bacillus subtilis TaxID=1423 RepID=UPI0024178EFC|nr:helix-turn-helix transcriptional regulator [Bacillus subtilis]
MKRAGKTQAELAELTGIRPNAISELCRGHRERIQLDHISRIAAALNIKDIRELIDLIDEEDGGAGE